MGFVRRMMRPRVLRNSLIPEETWATLREAGVIIVTDITTEAAVDALCAALDTTR